MNHPAFQDPPEHPLDEALVAWMIEPTAPDDEGPVASHLFACGRCTGRVEALSTVVGGLAVLQRHRHQPIQTRASLAELEVRACVQHFFGRDGSEVASEISRDADVVILHLPLSADERSTLVVSLCEPDGRVFIAFEADGAEEGEVMLACHRHVAEGNERLRVRVSRQSDRQILCDAVFVQAPR